MEHFDVVGAGLGPFNLSLAALVDPLPDVRARFCEARETFRWHSGMMLPGSLLQVSFLKDLVTLVDPSSPYSFLKFLACEGRLYRFLIAHGDRCSRQEFERYYEWVAGQLKDVRWGQKVEQVRLAGDRLAVTTADGTEITTDNVVLGSGRTPWIPPFAVPLAGDSVFHSGELQTVHPQLAGRRVIVVGAGQSGAETVRHLLTGALGLPAELTWVSSRVGFLPIDDSPFTNEWFHPRYVDHFFGLSDDRRRELLARQRLASDGVAEPLLREIYRQLYDLDVLTPGRLRHRLLACRRIVDLRRDGDGVAAALLDEDTGATEVCPADVVVLATGYRSEFPAYLEPLRARLTDADGRLRVRRDYSLGWDGPEHLGIYVQNAAEDSHGIADPNLSLASWRSARIINAICQRPVYPVEEAESTVAWSSGLAALDPAALGPATFGPGAS